MTLTTPRLTQFIPHKPLTKQAAFLLLNAREALYGGAAGGGKSDALLMAALQYVDVPGYAALLLRRTFHELSKPGALMDRAHQWLAETAARWNERDKQWTFPSGATLTFGYMENENDKYQYQSSEFHFIGFDELTQFRESMYTYLFIRLRRLMGVDIPLRMRAATNPGGIGHEWVRQRFITGGKAHGRVFIPALLDDNLYIDKTEYVANLQQTDAVTFKRMRYGDWDVRDGGSKFRREWFEVVDDAPKDVRKVRYWDLAGTEPNATYPDPDWTAGVLLGRSSEGVYYVLDVQHKRLSPGKVERLIRATAEADGRNVPIWIEQEGGASGKAVIERYRRAVLDGWIVQGDAPGKDKVTRATPVSAKAEAGDMKVVRGAWLSEFWNELEAFPDGAHDDIVDALSGAYGRLTAQGVGFG